MTSLYVIDFKCVHNFGEAHPFSEAIAEDSIAVAQKVAREVVKGKCLL